MLENLSASPPFFCLFFYPYFQRWSFLFLPIHQPSIPPVLLHKPPLQLQTDSAHKGNSIPLNSAPPIGLHAHSVVVPSEFPCAASHTQPAKLPMHSHATLMGRQPPQKQMAQESKNSIPRIRECS
jgi:hypothetical protein